MMRVRPRTLSILLMLAGDGGRGKPLRVEPNQLRAHFGKARFSSTMRSTTSSFSALWTSMRGTALHLNRLVDRQLTSSPQKLIRRRLLDAIRREERLKRNTAPVIRQKRATRRTRLTPHATSSEPP